MPSVHPPRNGDAWMVSSPGTGRHQIIVYASLSTLTASGPVLEEGATTCCYAQSEKSWIDERAVGDLSHDR